MGDVPVTYEDKECDMTRKLLYQAGYVAIVQLAETFCDGVVTSPEMDGSSLDHVYTKKQNSVDQSERF